ncbi:MAG: sugar phosphate nucleotidyltransferase [Thermoplasmata archaeon]|nr:sugar phosphate nucleotidyltransferase [Thermoplasmata archaeon]
MRLIALVLAGGRVDELGVLTLTRPKSAVPFGGIYRIIDFPLSNLHNSGIEVVGILSQYNPSELISHIGSGIHWDLVGRGKGIKILPPYKGVRTSDWYRGTADAVYQNLAFIQEYSPDNVLILSGDHIYCMDYNEIISLHLEKNADLTVGFVKVDPSEGHRFGMADIGKDGWLRDYVEKPEKTKYEWASLTIYAFKTEVLIEALKKNAREKSHEFGRDVIPEMMKAGKNVYGYKFGGYWGYTRTLHEYFNTNMDLLGEEPKIKPEECGIRTNIYGHYHHDLPPSRFYPTADVEDALIARGCRIKGKVSHSIISSNVVIEKGAVVKNSLIMCDCFIGEGTVVEYTIIDEGTVLGKNSVIGGSKKITCIGKNARIPDTVSIGEGCVVWPFTGESSFKEKRIEPGTTVGGEE